MLGESVETFLKNFTDVLFCKVKLSKMASTKTNKIKKQTPLSWSNFLSYTTLLWVQKDSSTLTALKMFFVPG